MASLRRSHALSSDTNAKFLYAILKQLDVKSINWQKVADEMEITNGHAARMRYTRFKQHTEGTVPGRKSRASPEDRQKKKRATRAKRSKQVEEDDEEGESTKEEEGGTGKEEGVIKMENPDAAGYGEEDGYGEMEETYMYCGSDGACDAVKKEVIIKTEPEAEVWAGIGEKEWTFYRCGKPLPFDPS